MKNFCCLMLFFLMFLSWSVFAKSFQCTPLGNVDSTIPAKQIASRLNIGPYQMGHLPGLLVGIVKNNKTQLFTCGETAIGSGQRPDGNTVWQIGSVSKVITSTIFSMMLSEDKVRLTDALSNYVPDNISVPSFHGRDITLLDLATHTASLPREITGIKITSGFQVNDHFDRKQAFQWLSQYQLKALPGTLYHYSNIGYGLLGNALAMREKTTYADLVQRYINQRLKMHDTTVTPSKSQKAREAKSYWMNSDLIQKDWQFDFDRPSGGVYSTGNDLLKFIRYQLNLMDVKSGTANQLAHASYVYRGSLVNRAYFSDSAMALGWSVDEPRNGLPLILHKNGWVSGFNTWVILAPTEKIGIFSISNKPYLTINQSLLSIVRMLAAA